MTNLSPEAQAVLEAAAASEPGIYATISASLRAAADQVAPTWDEPSWDYELVMGTWQESERIRRELLAIAAELETSTTENR